jgi:hypothetical protein
MVELLLVIVERSIVFVFLLLFRGRVRYAERAQSDMVPFSGWFRTRRGDRWGGEGHLGRGGRKGKGTVVVGTNRPSCLPFDSSSRA